MLTSPPGSLLLGAEAPRVELRQPAAYSLGGPAEELSARAGLVLEPWQASGLEMMLDVRADGRWAAFEYAELCPRQNGKTALLAARALAGLFLLDERLIMWSAHEYKTAMESFLLMRDLIGALGETTGARDNLIDVGGVLVKVNSTNGEEQFERLDTRQRLKFLARSKGSGRGFSGDCNLIDEAFAYTPAQQSALMPTMNARPNPQICYASSPPLDSDSGEVLFALRRRAEAGEAGLNYRDWGLAGDLDELMRLSEADRSALLDDRTQWAASNPALGRGRVDEESILRNRRAMREEDFAREIGGIWPVPPEEGGRVIRSATWNALADPSSTIVSQCVFAIDANPERTWAAIAAAGRNADGVPHVELVPPSADGGPWPRALDWVVPRCIELNTSHEPVGFVIDPSGPAGSLTKELADAGLPVFEVTGREWVQACELFYDAVHAEPQGLAHLGDPLLSGAVSAARKRDVGDGAFAWGRKNSQTNIAPLVAATLAFQMVGSTYDALESVW